LFESNGLVPLETTADRVRLAPDTFEVVPGSGEFLEGIDIPGEDGFEDWLRDMRRRSADRGWREAKGPIDASFHRAPSIAILAFENATGDLDAAYLADGIGEELVDRVSRLRWLPVISPGQIVPSSASASMLESGRSLGASYVLGGRLHRQGAEYRLSGQILNVATAELIWSIRLRLPDPRVDNALAPVVADLVAVLENRVVDAEQLRARAVPEVDMTVADLVWRGRWHQDRLSRDDTAIAGRLLGKAIRLAPDLPVAVIEYARHLAYKAWNQRLAPNHFHEIRDLAQRAIVLDYADARGHMLAGLAEMWLRNTAAAEILLLRAVDLNPSLSIAWEQLGSLRILDSKPKRALEPLAISLRLAPTDYRQFFKHGETGLAHLMMGDHDRSIDRAERSISLRPSYWPAHVTRINALVRSGRAGPAAAAWHDLVRARPNFVTDYIDWVPFVDTGWHEFLRDGLRQAQALDR